MPLFIRSLLLCAALLLAAPAAGQDTDRFVVDVIGIGPQAFRLTPTELARFDPVEMDVTYRTSQGEAGGRFRGVLMWNVLADHGAFSSQGHNEALRKTLTVRGRDGYEIVFSLGEIHPDFGDTPVLLADQVDGRPFESGYRIIVPGDTRGARNVRDVTRIEMR